jgi:capsid protein
LGFRRNQRFLIELFHKPVREWKLRQFCADEPTLRAAAARLGSAFFKSKWHLPTWPYIDPSKDADADLTRVRNCLASMTHVQGENSADWDEVFPQIIDERGNAIEAAIERANKINQKYNLQGAEKVSRRELLPLPQPEGVTAKLTGADDSESGTAAQPAQPGQPQPEAQPVQTPRSPKSPNK